MQYHYFECKCRHDEHVIRFVIDKDDGEINFYCHVFLAEKPLFKRIWLAIKYVLGFKTKYGHFGEWILNKKDAKRLRKLINDVIRHERNKNV